MRLTIVLTALLLAACAGGEAPASADATPATTSAPTDAAPELVEDSGPRDFRAFGTEPFWNVDVTGDTLLFTTPEDQAGQALAGTRSAFAKGVEISGTHAGKPFVLVIRSGECSDGMSDNTYAMDAEFDIHGQSLKGCAELRE